MPQVYIGPPSGANATYPGVQFAATALVGFANIELAAGQSQQVEIGILRKQLSFYDVSTGQFTLAKGVREVWVGKSVNDILSAGTISL